MKINTQEPTHIQQWVSMSFRVDNSIINYTVERDNTIWIYFAYAPTSREFYQLVKHFSIKYPKQEYDTILFITKYPSLFRSHIKHRGDNTYQWER